MRDKWAAQRVKSSLGRKFGKSGGRGTAMPMPPICMCMATYTVTPKADRTRYTVAILDGEGALQTTLGFTREAEADTWVTQATRMNKSWAPGRSFGKPKYP